MAAENFDYEVLYKTFSKLIYDYIGLTMIELNGGGIQPKPPFCVFDIISPYIPLNYLEDDSSGAFECVVSFTVYDLSKVSALSKAGELRKMLDSINTLDRFKELNIVLVEKMPTQIRYVQESNQIAKMVGFDCRLRLHDVAVDDVEPITDIKLKEM